MSEEKVMDYEEQKKNEQPQNPVEEASKKYGLNLSDVEEVRLPNGKEYFKFFDNEDNSVRMIENRKDGKNLLEQFKSTQERLGLSQGENEKQNARAIFDYIVKYNNIELSLITIADLKHNKSEYQGQFNSLDSNNKKELRTILECAEQYEITHINLENMLAISKNNNVFKAVYNSQTNMCELVAVEVKNYQTNKTTGNNENYIIEISEEEFDQIVADYDFESMENQNNYSNTTTNNSIVVKNRVIDFSSAVAFYKTGTDIDNLENMTTVDRFIYKGIVSALIRKKQKANVSQKNKQYILKKAEKQNNQAAFIDSILLSLLLGFFSGLLMSVIVLAIKMNV